MKEIPKSIKEIFYKTIKGDIPINDFEQWLYNDKELEKLLKLDDYLELILLKFNKSGAKYELWNLLKNTLILENLKLIKCLYF